MIKVVINGIWGRMGQELARAISSDEKFELVGGVDTRAGEWGTGIPVVSEGDQIIPKAEVVIDFSLPAGALNILESCVRNGKPLVTGTTGFESGQLEKFRSAGAGIGIVQAFNFSIGINLLLRVVTQAAGVLQGKSDIEIVETHHRMKKDAPSGTALMLAQKLAETLNRPPEDRLLFGRHGRELQRLDEIGIHSVRGGSVVGEHQVLFLGENENLTFSHQALNRKIFVDGALQAAEWIVRQKPGLYSMQDVLGFSG